MIHLLEDYRLQVAELTVRLVLWDRGSIDATLYLRLASTRGAGWESLGERLNDPEIRFLACQNDGEIELVHLDSIAYVEAPGRLPEITQREQVGALRHPADVILRCGQRLTGEFLSIMPPGRLRLSDLLNAGEERFYLFPEGQVTRYIHRDAISRVVPGEDDPYAS
ncbi:MAG TPA: hypothetical protein VMW27_16190 [Thermoanaerobaculia bacterium]|nr:hypothetical protein [Thermoanaerobaculia bacterium]